MKANSFHPICGAAEIIDVRRPGKVLSILSGQGIGRPDGPVTEL
jgi:hypothetical protein